MFSTDFVSTKPGKRAFEAHSGPLSASGNCAWRRFLRAPYPPGEPELWPGGCSLETHGGLVRAAAGQCFEAWETMAPGNPSASDGLPVGRPIYVVHPKNPRLESWKIPRTTEVD